MRGSLTFTLFCSYVYESKDAILAVAKHIVLKAPDKADFRTTAAEAAVQLIQKLPAQEKYAFLIFAACLSRSAKVRSKLSQEACING